jgi:GMP synthase (glutamine-hydrolysing)
MKRILVIQCGSTDPGVAARRGDFPVWFARRLAPLAELTVARPWVGLPSPARFHGVTVTGSPHSVCRPPRWLDPLADWLLDAARRVPVLGVCFGHQVLGRALGGRVERNPRGREVGTVQVRLTAAGRADPLFAGCPDSLSVQQTHEDHVPELPPGAVLLAGNDATPVQAFAWGDRIRCVQFHPEMDAEDSRLLAEARRPALDRGIPGGCDAVLGSIRETPAAARILRAWAERHVGARAASTSPGDCALAGRE